MITTNDLNKEIKILEDVVRTEKDINKKATLKSQVLILKLLHNIRTNIVKVMEHYSIEKVKPLKKDEIGSQNKGE